MAKPFATATFASDAPREAVLIDRLVPARLRATRGAELGLDLGLALAGSVLLALSAKVQVPLFVPITLQTLVLLVLAASLGARRALAAVALYLIEGAAGLPVFAGTPQQGLGLAYMVGPTGGFLLGFLVAAGVVGALAERGFTRTVPLAVLTMTLGHGILFAFGYLWLAMLLGAERAFTVGVAPFFAATAIKTLLAATIVPAASGVLRRLGR